MSLVAKESYPSNIDEPELRLVASDIDVFEDTVFHDHFLHSEKIESSGQVISVGLENKIADEEAEVVWKMYERGFRVLNKGSLSRQSLMKAELLKELEDPGVIKYVARNSDGTIMGFMAVDKYLYSDQSEDLPTADYDLLDVFQQAVDPEAPSYYINTFLVDKESEHVPDMISVGDAILQGALLHFREVNSALGHDSFCFFDFASANAFLPQFIELSSRKTVRHGGCEVKVLPVYTHEWYLASTRDITPENLEYLANNMPENSFGDFYGPRLSEELPNEIQKDNLEGNPDDYCYLADVASVATGDVKAKLAELFENSPDLLDKKKYVLFDIKRLGAQDGVLPLGLRVSCQSFDSMELVEKFLPNNSEA